MIKGRSENSGGYVKKISWSCTIIGVINIVLAILNVGYILFLPKGIVNEIIGFILPFGGIGIFVYAFSTIYPKLQLLISGFFFPFLYYFFSIILFVSGIGLIFQKKYAKLFIYIYTGGIVAASIIGITISVPKYFAVYYSEIEKQGPLAQGLAWGGALVYILVLLGALLYPIILLIFFSRPKIKELFSK